MAKVGGEPRFAIGERVLWRFQGISGLVTREILEPTGVFYEVFFSESNVKVLPGRDLLPGMRRHPLLDSLLSGRDYSSPVEFCLWAKAQALSTAHSQDPYVSLSCSRLEPRPHQVFVTHRATSTLYPRLLLADEVGLGKTIEAGMVLKELKARGLVKRTLIVVPANLVTQWERELRTKFNERFTIYNSERERLYGADHAGKNIWEVHDQIICSMQFARDDERAKRIAEVNWDLVVFDEAHHVRRSKDITGEERARKAYRLGESLREKTKALLLLTATPLQLQRFEFYSLIELLDPSVFPTEGDFNAHVDVRREINLLLARLESYPRLDPEGQAGVVQHLLQMAASDNGANDERAIEAQLSTGVGRERVIDELCRNDALTKLMIRNRKRVIGGFTERRPRVIEVEMTAEEQHLYEQTREYIKAGYGLSQTSGDRTLGFVMVIFQKLLTSSPRALVSALRRRIDRLQQGARMIQYSEPEDEASREDEELSDELEEVIAHADLETITSEISILEDLCLLVSRVPTDTKLERLVQTVAPILAHDNEKVLIFTQFKETMEYIRQRLAEEYSVVTFHGGMDAESRDKAVEAFRESCQVMIATDAGSEGRNFQFCNCLVNYDLPWNPMRVEQRIGRLDRIGQTKDVFIYNFSIAGTIESRILSVLGKRIRVFEETIGGLDPILGDIEKDITRLLMSDAADVARTMDTYEISLEDRIRKAREAEEKMADFLMDRSSFRKDTYSMIQNRRPAYTHDDLEQLVRRYFDLLSEQDAALSTEARCLRVLPGGVFEILPPKAWERSHPDLYSFTRIVGTCDPSVALKKENVSFLAFGDPVFDAIISDIRGRYGFSGPVTSMTLRGFGSAGERLLYCQVMFGFDGVRPFRRLEPMCVDLYTHEYSPDLSRAIAEYRDVPEVGGKAGAADSQLIQAAWEQIHGIAAERLEILRSEILPENERLYELEVSRIRRLTDYHLARIDRELIEAEGLVEKFSVSTLEEERRVLPIFRARVRDLHVERQSRSNDLARELESLEQKRELGASFEITSASLVFITL